MVEKLSKWKCVRVQGDKLRLVFDWSFVFICLPCSGQWKEYKRVYEHILETDKKLDQSRKNLVSQPTDLNQQTLCKYGSWYDITSPPTPGAQS